MERRENEFRCKKQRNEYSSTTIENSFSKIISFINKLWSNFDLDFLFRQFLVIDRTLHFWNFIFRFSQEHWKAALRVLYFDSERDNFCILQSWLRFSWLTIARWRWHAMGGKLGNTYQSPMLPESRHFVTSHVSVVAVRPLSHNFRFLFRTFQLKGIHYPHTLWLLRSDWTEYLLFFSVFSSREICYRVSFCFSARKRHLFHRIQNVRAMSFLFITNNISIIFLDSRSHSLSPVQCLEDSSVHNFIIWVSNKVQRLLSVGKQIRLCACIREKFNKNRPMGTRKFLYKNKLYDARRTETADRFRCFGPDCCCVSRLLPFDSSAAFAKGCVFCAIGSRSVLCRFSSVWWNRHRNILSGCQLCSSRCRCDHEKANCFHLASSFPPFSINLRIALHCTKSEARMHYTFLVDFQRLDFETFGLISLSRSFWWALQCGCREGSVWTVLFSR